jgi:hypothetical protein
MSKYWWVNHKQTFRHEIDGGYLWSPKTEKNGARSQFYDNMRLTSPGDIVVSFANARIAFVGRVVDYALTSAKPAEFGAVGTSWSTEGWLLPIAWQSLAKPVRPKDNLRDLSAILPHKYSPIHPQTGSGNQKAYLAEISQAVFDVIARLGEIDLQKLPPSEQNADTFGAYVEQLDDCVERQLRNNQELSLSEKDLIIKARRGQGAFRANVQKIERKCRLTGISDPSLLIASHIKPWRSCVSTNERLDGSNGLLLTPHVDLIFDRGLISFLDNGSVLLSPRLNPADLKLLGLADCVATGTGAYLPTQCAYLAYHRANVFLP